MLPKLMNTNKVSLNILYIKVLQGFPSLQKRPTAPQHAPRIRLINRNINVKLLFFS